MCSKNEKSGNEGGSFPFTVEDISALETEIRLVRARNDRLELEVVDFMQFAQRVRRYLDEQSAIHSCVKRMELDGWLRDRGIE